MNLEIRRLPEGVEIRVLVHPRSPRVEVGGSQAGALRVRVNAPPSGGQANEAAKAALARALRIRPSDVQLVSGERSRRKRIRIGGDPGAIIAELERLQEFPRRV